MSNPNSVKNLLTAFEDSRQLLASWLIKRYVTADEVEDLLQETFLKAFERSQKIDIHSPKAYLFQTARNIVIKQFRKRANLVDLTELGMVELESEDVGIEEAILQRERFQKFLEAVLSLPDQCRTVFILRKFHGLSNAAISRKLGIAPKTVEAHLTKALKRCGRKLALHDAPIELDNTNATLSKDDVSRSEVTKRDE